MGSELIGLHSTMPINPFLPLIMFAILFGLSMDYEVFLLSRVREEYVATGDNHEAVVRGLSSTARVITSAALIMISVFGAFVLSDDPNGKLFGVGLAVAVLLDATLVRMVLVPATMSLVGRANWWLPAWLDRILPHLDLEGAPQVADGAASGPSPRTSPSASSSPPEPIRSGAVVVANATAAAPQPRQRRSRENSSTCVRRMLLPDGSRNERVDAVGLGGGWVVEDDATSAEIVVGRLAVVGLEEQGAAGAFGDEVGELVAALLRRASAPAGPA